MDSIIHSFIRDPRTNNPIGILTASVAAGTVLLGWSKCNPKDRFDKVKGLRMAKHRMEHGVGLPTRDEVISPADVVKMKARAVRYFKLV